jgi:hypothetical protein
MFLLDESVAGMARSYTFGKAMPATHPAGAAHARDPSPVGAGHARDPSPQERAMPATHHR